MPIRFSNPFILLFSAMIRILAPFRPGGDAEVDIPRIRMLYRKEMARDPSSFADIHDATPGLPDTGAAP